MTYRPGLQPEPEPELESSKVSGGVSPRLAALGAIGVLVVVVAIGLSGKGAAPSVSTPPAATSSATHPAVAQATPATLPGLEIEPPWPGARPISDGAGTPTGLAVSIDVNGHVATAQLSENGTRQYNASYSLPLPLPTAEATIELLDISKWPKTDSYGRWTVPLDVFNATSAQPGAILLDNTHQPEAISQITLAPAIYRSGYRIIVSGERNAQGGQLNVDLSVGQDPVWPDETYQIEVSAKGLDKLSVGTAVTPGDVRGEIVLPKSFSGNRLSVILSRVTSDGHSDQIRRVGSFEIELPGADEYPNGTRTLDASAVPSSDAASTGIVANGYRIKVVSVFDGPRRAVFYDVLVNATYDPVLFPRATVSGAITRNWVTGDDGLVGWPSSARL